MQSEFNPQSTAPSSETDLEAEFRSILRTKRRQAKQPEKWFHYLLDFLTGRTEISIRQRQTSSGLVQWIAYDPYLDRRSVFDSEQAVRIWLEQRHRAI